MSEMWHWHDDFRKDEIPGAISSRVMPLCGWPYISLWNLDTAEARAFTLTINLLILLILPIVLRLSIQISRDGK